MESSLGYNGSDITGGSITANQRCASAVYFALASLVVIAGNVLTLCVVGKKKRRKPTDLLLGVLAATDLATPVLVLPFLVMYGSTGSWAGGKAACFMSAFLSMFLFKFSMLVASLVAIDRYLAISKPFFYRSKILIRPTRYAVGLSGVYSLALALIPFSGILLKVHKIHTSEWPLCFFHWLAEQHAKTLTTTYIILCSIDTGLAVLVVLLCNIGVVVYFVKRRHQRGKNVAPVESVGERPLSFSMRPPRNHSQRRNDLKYAKLMSAVSCYFPLCFLPIQVLVTLQHIGAVSMKHSAVAHYQLHAVLIGLLLNPLLHAFIRKHYRRAYWFIIRHPRALCVTFNGEFDFDADYREISEFERKQMTLREISVTALATARFRARIRKTRAEQADNLNHKVTQSPIPTIVKRNPSLDSDTKSFKDFGRTSSATECSESSPMNLRARREFHRSLSWTSSYFSDYDGESLPPSPGYLLVPHLTARVRSRVSSTDDSDKTTICSEHTINAGSLRPSFCSVNDGSVRQSFDFDDSRRPQSHSETIRVSVQEDPLNMYHRENQTLESHVVIAQAARQANQLVQPLNISRRNSYKRRYRRKSAA
ncbi:5-hydroxytryptamine receptor 7 [Nematostella vectensis]|uniref:5-hydroxytryptamine receptor 7 n=1 Tax=Nematostella vectensis TaxID=45351 RepID=UPI002076E88A|nr:5-hydroxytryptamine receptor 7 [Nematostella vectensis]